ncbi:MAG: undecaprenyldiphospho-muramoylpentapeptide beta-N-acetylglucosaminyltransferase, partial [Actinomycetota bacterium]
HAQRGVGGGQERTMRVVIAGGGTAGHVFPALAIADRLRDAGHEVRFVGSGSGQEASLVPAAGFRFTPVKVDSAQSRLSLRSVRAVWLSVAAMRAVRSVVRSADVVVGIGGYASAPSILAARLARRPIVLIEQNSVPGVVNRLGSRWARVVATTFQGTAARLPAGVHVVRTGNPIRRAVAEVAEDARDRRVEALEAFDLEAGRTTVSVFGGSQGALGLDRIVAATIELLRTRPDLQLLVAAGAGREGEIAPAASRPGALLVRVVGFIDRMDLALAVTDLAVSRAGSGHLAELSACGIPAILVPYPFATEHHQEENARELARAGAAEVHLEHDLTPERLMERIEALVDDEPARRSMAVAARAWARPDADRRIADLVVGVAS